MGGRKYKNEQHNSIQQIIRLHKYSREKLIKVKTTECLEKDTHN